MKIVGQPESYSDMLERIFALTVASGVICTFILADASPEVAALLDSVKTQADIGPVKSLKALYVLVPIAIAHLALPHSIVKSIKCPVRLLLAI